MLRLRRLIVSFLSFVLILGVFTVLVPVLLPQVQSAYAELFRGGISLVFGKFGSDGRVHLEPLTSPHPDHDTKIRLEHRWNGGFVELLGDSRTQGYLPTAFITALALASPIPWRRRWRAVIGCLVVITAFVGLRVLVFLLWEFSGEGGPAFIELGAFWRTVLKYAHWLTVESFAGCYIIPLPLWFCVTFRRSDWTDRPAPSPKAASEPHTAR